MIEAAQEGRLALLPHPRQVDLDPTVTVAAPFDRPASTAVVPGIPTEGYRIGIGPDHGSSGVTVEASGEPGFFYARQTLAQLRRIFGEERLPAGRIEDWPDLPVRGVMLDVSRTKVPTLDTLFGIVDRLASWKFNHLELYMEHTYAYSRHAEVWSGADPYDAADLERLSSYCSERHIELVPNQNTLGHMERWLIHDRYTPLGIKRGVVMSPFGMEMAASTLEPGNPESLDLIRELVGELAAALPAAGRFHVGLDEPWELSRERSGDWAKWLASLRSLRELDDRELLVWGDVLAAHPHLMDELRREPAVTVCEWGYEANHPFTQRSEALSAAGIDHWLSPGTSSWMSILGRATNAVENCRSAATAAGAAGATGLVVTDWGDFGHLQYLPVSDPGLAAAAAFSWCSDSNRHLDATEIGRLLDLHAFEDSEAARASKGAGIGEALALLGDLHTVSPVEMPNMSSLVMHVYLPQLPVGRGLTSGLEPSHLDEVESRLADAIRILARARPGQPHGQLAIGELVNSARLVAVACRDARARLEGDGSLVSVAPSVRANLADETAAVIDEHRALWLRRNRPGGLDESCAWLDHLRECYLSGAPDSHWAGPLVEQLRLRFRASDASRE